MPIRRTVSKTFDAEQKTDLVGAYPKGNHRRNNQFEAEGMSLPFDLKNAFVVALGMEHPHEARSRLRYAAHDYRREVLNDLDDGENRKTHLPRDEQEQLIHEDETCEVQRLIESGRRSEFKQFAQVLRLYRSDEAEVVGTAQEYLKAEDDRYQRG